MDRADVIEIHGLSAAMKDEIGTATWWNDDDGCGIEMGNHDDGFLV